MRSLWILPLLLLSISSVAGVNAPYSNAVTTVTAPKIIQSPLNMTLLSLSINNCSQTANINSTWTGQVQFYPVSPDSFSIVIRSKNAIYSNSTDLISPNNIVSQWFLFRNIPITLSLSFVSCSPIGSEILIYSDGTFFFRLN